MIIKDDNSVHCSGSIIAPKRLLTAGHCFANNSDNYIPKERLRVVFGIHDLNMLDLSFVNKTIRNIKRVIVHPDYSWQEAYSDLVILEVDKKVTFSETIFPVCLPDYENSDKNHLVRESVTVVGFGPKNEESKTMRQISQKIRSFDFCNERYNPENADIQLRPLIRKELPSGFDDTLTCAQNW